VSESIDIFVALWTAQGKNCLHAAVVRAATGGDDVGAAEVVDEAVVVLGVVAGVRLLASKGETCSVLLCRLTVRLTLEYGPTTEGTDALMFLIRRM
jgi:hypothetical protein